MKEQEDQALDGFSRCDPRRCGDPPRLGLSWNPVRRLISFSSTCAAVLVLLAPLLSCEKDRRKAQYEAARTLGVAIHSSGLAEGSLTDLLADGAAESLCTSGGWRTIDQGELRQGVVEAAILQRARRLDVELQLRCDPVGVAVESGDGAVRWEDGFYVQ